MVHEELFENKIVRHEALTFDDVLLLPGYTDFKRRDVSLQTNLHAAITLSLPVVSSPMDTVTESEMAISMASCGGLGIIHRNLSITAQADEVKKVKKAVVQQAAEGLMPAMDAKKKLLVGAAVGLGEDFDERVEALVNAGVDIVVIDSGHGYTSFMVEGVRTIRSQYKKLPIMAGNVATFGGARALVEVGADVIRVGMGPGSICTTRIVTGMGVPQLSAVAACVRATAGTKSTVIADGGIRQMGDMAKALAFGAHAVMLGSLLARYDESPGESIEVDGKKYKQYRGMGSVGAMKKGGAERYGQSVKTQEKKLIPEGVEALVEYKGPVSDYLYQIAGSLRSSFYYIGAKTVSEFFEKSRCIKISQAGLIESHPHSVVITNAGNNYSTK